MGRRGDGDDTLEVTRAEHASEEPRTSLDASRERASLEQAPVLAAGTNVDHYRIMRLLGRGGMGEVYLARDNKLGRKVALKLVQADLLGSERDKERFLFEARATAAFNHPHIVTIYGTGEWDGRPYVALEYLEGQNLLERHHERALSLRETLRIVGAIAEALATAHERGILHRDLKPANVVIPHDGRLRVVDFGLARVVADDLATSDAPSFVPGLVEMQSDDTWTAGTPGYMPPEQWRGEVGGAATDVWALGVMTFELCAGRKPFEGDSTMMLAAAVCGDERAPPLERYADVPPELSTLVAKCLEKRAEERPTARAIADVMATLIEDQDAPEIDSEPFRGLRAFGEAQQRLFFGREAEVAAFVERVRVQPMLGVIGPSGAGKSSFVSAGVIGRLREQEPWQVVALRPQARPFRALAAALVDLTGDGDIDGVAERLRREPASLSIALRRAADGRKLLLVVDQLEELFTIGDDALARAFLRALAACADDVHDPLRVVFTLRHDFLDRLAIEPSFGDALGQITVIRRPSPEALARIVRQPVEAKGYRFEDDAMVGEMIASVADSPACLPLLSFAAAQLWEQRDDKAKLILRARYDELGGVAGALASHADGVVAGLSDIERHLARELLLRLVTAERTRKVVLRSDALEGLGGAESVLDRLTDARLVSVIDNVDGQSALELAHESLTVTWRHLARWLDESDDDLGFLEQVGQAAELWHKRGQKSDELWHGGALAEAMHHMKRCTAEVPPRVREFLTFADRQERGRRRQRRVAVGVAFAVVSMVAVVLAWQKREADAQRTRAEERQQLSESRQAQALREGARAAMGEGRWLEARAKLRSALEIEDDESARALWWQLGRESLRWRVELAATAYSVAFSPDGKLLAAASQNGTVYLIDVVDKKTRVLRGHDDQVFTVAFSPDGTRLASGSFDGDIHIWDVATTTIMRSLVGHTTGVWTLSFSPDGKSLASSGMDATARVWDLAGAADARVLRGHEGDVFGIAFSPDGKWLATSGFDRTVRLWPLGGGEPRIMTGHSGHVFIVAFSKDGSRLASASRDGTVRVWDVARADLAATIETGGVFGVDFNPDGSKLATTGVNGDIAIWDVARRALDRHLGKHEAVALTVAFSPDGRFVASGGDDRMVFLFDTATVDARAITSGHSSGVNRVRFSPDGSVIGSAGHDGDLRLWSAQTGDTLRTLRGHSAPLRSLAFSDDGRRVASAGHDNQVRIWRVADGGLERVLSGHAAAVFGVDFHPDGDTLVTSSRDGSVRLWSIADGRETRNIAAHEGGALDVAFSGDGQLIASAGADRVVRIWDTKSGAHKQALVGHEAEIEGLAFAADGTQLVSGSRDGSVRLWRLDDGSSRLLGKHDGRVYWLAMHEPSELVAAPDSDGKVLLWSTADAPMRTLCRHDAEVNSVSFDPSGQLLATGSDDETLRTWHVDGMPLWRAPIVIDAPARMLTQRGWLAFGGGEARAPAWSAALTETVKTRAYEAALIDDAVCVRSADGVEMWNVDGIEPSARRAIAGIAELVALPWGCAARGEREVVVVAGDGRLSSIAIDGEPLALGATSDALLVATRAAIVAFDRHGVETRRTPVGAGVRALVAVGDAFVVGYRDGHIATVPSGDELPFEETPHASPSRIVAGPRGTIVVGYQNGLVAMWRERGGPRLAHARLHGSVVHLRRDGERLHVATDLGQHLTWELTAFHRDYCDLLRGVWRAVPVVWEGGRAVAKPAPREHGCL